MDRTERGSSLASTTPADSIATSVPAPMAMPTSARARAGASLTPSPTMATVNPRSCSSVTVESLSSGRTSEKTSSIPRSAPTARATWSASPVIMATRMPRSCRAWTAARDSGRTWSSTAIAPMTVPSRTTWSTPAPRRIHSPVLSASPSGGVSRSSRSMFGPPTRISEPSTPALIPRPEADVNPEPVSPKPAASEFPAAAAAIARATGCSLADSAAAASASRRPSETPAAATSVTACSPSVRVPVLSKRTTSMVRIRSSAIRSLISTPDFAARSVEMAMTRGIARPRACGQAMTRTVTVRVTASSGLPRAAHTAAVMSAAVSANQKSSAAARSASACAREEEA